MKASNPLVMVQAYRMLVQKMDEEGLQPYPLHLGVTEAGEGEDGRIKSAVGIGTLLEDGLGDTIRVSLTEEPEAEIPVARMLAERYIRPAGNTSHPEPSVYPVDPFHYQKRTTVQVENFGKDNVPRVIADFSLHGPLAPEQLKSVGHFYLPATDKWAMNDLGVDYLFTGTSPAGFMLPNGLKEIMEADIWKSMGSPSDKYPLLALHHLERIAEFHRTLNFVELSTGQLSPEVLGLFAGVDNVVMVLSTGQANAMVALRKSLVDMMVAGINLPVVLRRNYPQMEPDRVMVHASTDIGGVLLDGLGDGAMIGFEGIADANRKLANQTAFGILQAARTRITKTEYISCPSCGRTLFDLQETTARIRQRTDHLKGVKIGIMGCIVNGPGEMADADFGYVGSGKGKITLYKGKEVVKKAVPAAKALDELIELIRQEGRWIDPPVAQ